MNLYDSDLDMGTRTTAAMNPANKSLAELFAFMREMNLDPGPRFEWLGSPFGGIPIRTSPYVPATHTVFKVEKIGRKRRKGYRVARREEAVAYLFNPGAIGLNAAGGIVVNPAHAAVLIGGV